VSILRLVRNFALLAVSALAAHAAVGADKKPNLSCGAVCGSGQGVCIEACPCVRCPGNHHIGTCGGRPRRLQLNIRFIPGPHQRDRALLVATNMNNGELA
jgi:hypothetical protein